MNEKIKGMFGSKTRADEVIKWLESQGAVDCNLYDGSSEEVIYYVDNNEIKTINKRYSILFNIVELPRWRAKKSNYYYYINGGCQITPSMEILSETDDDRYKIGNYFKTREEAELYAKKFREIFKERR